MLTQEVRNPRAGAYNLSLHACGGGSPEDYRNLLLKHFTCRLVLFGYRNLAKDPRSGMREYASVPLRPDFHDGKAGGYTRFELTRALRSQDGGAAEIEMGVGVAIVLAKTSPGDLVVKAGQRAFLRIDDVDIRFVPRPRNDEVQV